ncbi:OPT family small oligopeptide transporter [Cladophialophora immunda]|uniref:OPT family small oligopeptide transporter n=1 Tax=Cladophialophora immunda TaxID=569365 RepID=A0A0D2B8F1_9EURO|nr:OPT family small oligopeptide transporter [Cladophialophora immunda]KIW33917.1 OPT family small oligopeptide transporter [Cladophialophora immunda]
MDARQRPGFTRTDTDGIPLEPISPSSSSGNIKKDAKSPGDSKADGVIDVKSVDILQESLPAYDPDNDGVAHIKEPVTTAEDLVTQVIHVQDDPSLNPWTFRVAFLGCGLSIFGAVLQEIFFFKPQTIFVSVVFLTVIAYILGEAMASIIPRKGVFRYLNPHPFNQKEHAAITIMASAASQAAQSTQALAAQALFYGGFPNKAAGIFVTMSSQLIGFGFAGLLRDVLVFPTRMLWPINLPVATLLETLHRDKKETKRKLRLFCIAFCLIFIWEILPEYIFPVLTGVSVFCLAKQDSLVFTNLFGGASGDEGLGFLSLCLDWNYIIAVFSPMWFPLNSLVNCMIGIVGCYIVFMGVYYGNVWGSFSLPFLSQELFSEASNSTNYVVYNQSAILNADFTIDPAKLAQEGLPQLTGTYIVYLITSNMGMTAAFTHMFIWNRNDLKAGWEWASPSNLRKLFRASSWKFWQNQESPEERLQRKYNDPTLDPHYKLMLQNKYLESPNWWWASVALISWVVGLGCLYGMHSTLPGWGFLLAAIFTFLLLLFLGAQMGLTGFQFNVQPICQMIAGYLFPHRPLANLYFTCYTFNTLQQGQLLAKDMKLAQYSHLPPRITFVVQVVGCLLGALFNWVMMNDVVENQRPILLAIQGSNIWSGQNIQIFNTLAISWSIADKMYSIGAKYQWVTIAFLLGFLVPLPFWLAHRYFRPWKVFSYLNTSIILWYVGNLFTGINSSFTSFYLVGFISQFYLRKYKPQFFVKYNYLLSAALDGGTQVMVFIFTFAVFGGSGKAHPFPTWAGNPDTSVHNVDYCMVNPANGG